MLVSGGTTARTSEEKAELLNSFFVSCFNNSHAPLDTSDSYSNCQECNDDIPDELLCTEDQICDLLNSLDVSKSCGPDNISAQMLKHTATSIAPAVTMLFNLSLREGKIPQNWKESWVVQFQKCQLQTIQTTIDQFLYCAFSASCLRSIYSPWL